LEADHKIGGRELVVVQTILRNERLWNGRFWRIVLKKSANWQFGIGQCNRRIGLDCA